MAKRKGKFSEGKQNIIAGLLEEYDIETAEDIQDALKDLLGGTIQSMMEAELDNHLGYEPLRYSRKTGQSTVCLFSLASTLTLPENGQLFECRG